MTNLSLKKQLLKGGLGSLFVKSSFAILASSPSARSKRTSIEGPPFMCESSSNAKLGVISSTLDSPKMISFRNLDFTSAALVVPGSVL